MKKWFLTFWERIIFFGIFFKPEFRKKIIFSQNVKNHFFYIQILMLIILFARCNLPKSFPEELEAVEKVEFFDIFSLFELIFYRKKV